MRTPRLLLLLTISITVAVGAAWPIAALAATQPRLGTATNFAVLAGQAITNTGSSTINGDVGLSPNGSSSVTGFPPGTINGGTHYADAVALQAKNDLVTAYNDAANQTPFVDLTGQNLGGKNLIPGTYHFSSSAQLTGPLTLSGFGTYIFQIGSTLTTASGSSVLLTNNAQACGVYWQVSSSATFGTTTSFQGTVMALASITMNNSATLIGRALARNGAVTLDTNTITRPAASCTGLPFTGVPLELLRGGFPWQLLLIGTAGVLGALVLGSSVRRRRRTS
ncbi:MAG: ice-binding family protein [Actinomycetota bacterium]|nr:ice-binding family protein [Actinomycetota bacterium]